MSAKWPIKDGDDLDSCPAPPPRVYEEVEKNIADAPIVTDDDPEEDRRLQEEVRKEIQRQETN